MTEFKLSDRLEAIEYFDTEKEIKEILSFSEFSNKTVIEVGCDTGRLTVNIAKVAKKIIAIDPWKQAIKAILAGEDETIKNHPQSKIVLKEMLSDFIRNNKITFTDSGLLICCRR